jgi:hypothetical protein
LTSTLASYVTSSSLTSTLASYVTNSSLTSTLSSYALTSSLASYVTSSSLTSTLSSYYTQTQSDGRYLPWCGGRMSGSGGMVASSTLTGRSTSTVVGAKTGTGTYTATFSTHPNGQSYTAIATPINSPGNFLTVSWESTSSTICTFYVRDNTNTLVNFAFNFIIFKIISIQYIILNRIIQLIASSQI